MSDKAKPRNFVISVAAGYREEQIRPFLASLAFNCPDVSLRLIVAEHNSEFENAVRAWIPDSSFHLLPPSGLRDFALKRKHVRSIFKRLTRWLPPPNFGRRLLKINFVRHIVIRDLLRSWDLNDEKILLVDSRDTVFQKDLFAGEWPALWTGEEVKRIGECSLNSFWFNRIGGPAALKKSRHHQIVCAGVIGGRAKQLSQYIEHSSAVVERLACRVALDDGDQGVHNNLVRLDTELDFTVLKNCDSLVSNVGYTSPEKMEIRNDEVVLLDCGEVPAVLHQYDRHPDQVTLMTKKWSRAKA